MTTANSGRMVVLIGGLMTVEDGFHVDSRQCVEGDGSSQVVRKSLASSWPWWNTTSSLVMPILEAAGPRAFALVIGERSIVELRSDGSIKRTGIRGLLAGGAGTLSVARTLNHGDDLPKGFHEVTTLRGRKGEVLTRVGVKGSVISGPRWRFLAGNEFYLTHAGAHIAPDIIVDTSDTVIFGEGDHIHSSCFEELERRRLFPHGTVLIVPHTYRAEVFFRAYVKWIQSSRPGTSFGSGPTPYPPPWNPSAATDPLRYTRLVPIDADFGVTGLVHDGQWQSPDDLEAARSLLEARFDLRIGIWDLVRNPLLCRTLLESTPVEPIPTAVAGVPGAAAKRARAAVATKLEQREHEAAALQTIQRQTKALLRAGWVENGPASLMELPLTEPVELWLNSDPRSLVRLSMSIVKRQTTVSVSTSMYNDVDLQRYISVHRTTLEQIAGMELPGLDKHWPVLWHGDGGWGDEIDWPARFDDLAAKTIHWIAAFAELVAECRRIQMERSRTA